MSMSEPPSILEAATFDTNQTWRNTLMTIDADQAWAETFCAGNGYGPPKVFGDGRWAAVQPRMFNATLIVAEIGDAVCYLDHWCYDSPLAAAAALQVWDGHGEPVGWFRHAASGRRVSRSADELDAQLRPVGAVGVTYHLH